MGIIAQAPCLPPLLQVKGYPTLKVMYKGEEVKTHRGSRDLGSLRQFIEDTARELKSDV